MARSAGADTGRHYLGDAAGGLGGSAAVGWSGHRETLPRSAAGGVRREWRGRLERTPGDIASEMLLVGLGGSGAVGWSGHGETLPRRCCRWG